MNFSKISRGSLTGKLMRFPLRMIPSEASVPILQGPMRGKKWVVGSATHGCWLGSYEYEKQRLFDRTITKGSVVFDIGANVGFYTLLASTIVGPSGKVFSFEPVPRNLRYLKRHLQLNTIQNVRIIEAAVIDAPGVVTFQEADNPAMGHISMEGKASFPAVSLDDLFARGKISIPDYIKIDVEGAEMLVLAGARSLLMKAQPTIFLATHTHKLHKECCAYLSSLSYSLQAIDGHNIEESSEIVACVEKSKR